MRLHSARVRRILAQGEMRARLVVVFPVQIEQMAQMPFAKDHDVIKTIPSDRANHSLRIPILPWRTCRDRPIPYAHCPNTPDKGLAINTVPVANDISRGGPPAVRFG